MIFVADPGAVLFNLTNQTDFKNMDTDYGAIRCGKDSGPMFTGALGTDNEPFNGDNCCSSGYARCYESHVDTDEFDMLIHRKADPKLYTDFSITELEVWTVKFSTE